MVRVKNTAVTLLQSIFKHPLKSTPVFVFNSPQTMLHILLKSTTINTIFFSTVQLPISFLQIIKPIPTINIPILITVTTLTRSSTKLNRPFVVLILTQKEIDTLTDHLIITPLPPIDLTLLKIKYTETFSFIIESLTQIFTVFMLG